jgi:3',5'-cyclic AMP phosphodiesterase CpdA
MKLYAISDLHLANRVNREGLLAMPAHPEDWLIVAGDVGERESHLHFALSVLAPRFRQVIWVPGNHDLWSLADEAEPLRGEEKYQRLVKICRGYGVLTPEDPYPLWPSDEGDGPGFLIAPLFLLYDYTFRPDDVPPEEAVSWAEESGVLCSDEYLLKPDPYPSRPAWCEARVRATERRLEAAVATGRRLVLVNHWPLRSDLVQLRRIPRFSIWCGTRLSEDWHTRFNAAVVVYGHLHIKGTHFRDGVRFEEVSLGYPRDWSQDLGVAPYLRPILPLPKTWLDGGG